MDYRSWPSNNLDLPKKIVYYYFGLTLNISFIVLSLKIFAYNKLSS